MKRTLTVVAFLVCFGMALTALLYSYSLRKKLNALTRSQLRTIVRMDNLDYKDAELDLRDGKFARVDSSCGIFFVKCESAEPYLDGYKLHLQIGNPSSATFSRLSMIVRWGTKKPPLNDPGYSGWASALRSKSFLFTESIEPGNWNKVDVVLTPAKADEVGFIQVSNVRASTLSLSPAL